MLDLANGDKAVEVLKEYQTPSSTPF